MLRQLIDPREEYLEYCRCVDACQKLNTLTNAVFVTHLSDSVIIKLTIFKYSGSISTKVFLNLSIDDEISLWGNRMILYGVIYLDTVPLQALYISS